MLGKSPRQVRRYVETGQLRASGGGHGVPYSFDAADVAALSAGYRPRQAWKGRVDADTLARIAHAVALRRVGQGRHYLLGGGFRALWHVAPKTAAGMIRNGLPPLAQVPPETLTWAEGVADTLTAQEVDYIAGMLIVRDAPGMRLEQAEAAALGGALALVERARPHCFRDESTLQQSPEEWAAIEGSVRASVAQYGHAAREAWIDSKRESFLSGPRSLAWSIYGAHNPRVPIVEALAGAVHLGEVEEVRRLVFASEEDQADGRRAPYPEVGQDIETGVRASLTAVTNKVRLWRRHADRNPNNGQVADVLGIYRAQGDRLVRSIKAKLGRSVVELFAVRLDCDAPRSWKARRA